MNNFLFKIKCCWNRFLLCFKPKSSVTDISLYDDDEEEYEYKVFFSNSKRKKNINIRTESSLCYSDLSAGSPVEYLNIDDVVSHKFKSASCSNLPDNKKYIDEKDHRYSLL